MDIHIGSTRAENVSIAVTFNFIYFLYSYNIGFLKVLQGDRYGNGSSSDRCCIQIFLNQLSISCNLDTKANASLLQIDSVPSTTPVVYKTQYNYLERKFIKKVIASFGPFCPLRFPMYVQFNLYALYIYPTYSHKKIARHPRRRMLRTSQLTTFYHRSSTCNKVTRDTGDPLQHGNRCLFQFV